MAKALRALLLAGTLLFLLIGESLGTAAAAGQAAIQAQGKFVASDRIVISGSITSGEGQWITLAVHEPSGKLFYINQTTSGAGGQFTFELPRGEQKTYTFSVNGSGADKYTGTIVESTGGGPRRSAGCLSGQWRNRGFRCMARLFGAAGSACRRCG